MLGTGSLDCTSVIYTGKARRTLLGMGGILGNIRLWQTCLELKFYLHVQFHIPILHLMQFVQEQTCSNHSAFQFKKEESF